MATKKAGAEQQPLLARFDGQDGLAADEYVIYDLGEKHVFPLGEAVPVSQEMGEHLHWLAGQGVRFSVSAAPQAAEDAFNPASLPPLTRAVMEGVAKAGPAKPASGTARADVGPRVESAAEPPHAA